MPSPVSPLSTSSAAPALLAADGLACRRGRRLLFRGLSTGFAAGSITWLRGSNGSGKTSLLRILAGLSSPAEGRVLWRGRPWREAPAAARRGVRYVGHANALKDDLTLLEAVAFWAALQGLPQPEAAARRALERMDLANRASALVRTLSQGQRRRGALARLALDEAATAEGRCWLLDEPFDALDADSVQRLAALLQAQAAAGGAVLLTSHQDVPLPGAQALDLAAWRAA